jgi:hypothetical protein
VKIAIIPLFDDDRNTLFLPRIIQGPVAGTPFPCTAKTTAKKERVKNEQ